MSTSTSTKSTSHEENKSQPQQQSGSFLGSMVQGFSFGVGSSIAHRVVGGIFGSSSSNPSTQSTQSTQPQTVHPNHSTQPIQTIQTIPIVNDTKINCQVDCDKFIKEYLQCIESASPEHCSHVFDGYKKTCIE